MSTTWNRLLLNKRICEACQCAKEAQQVVLPRGLFGSKILVLGRNPGRDEDAFGRPFIGRGGEMLDRYLAALLLNREEIMIENALACYTTNDHPPVKAELDACRFWIKQEMDLLKPEVVITLGNDALIQIMGPKIKSVMVLRGLPLPCPEFNCIVLPLLHPGQTLRAPEEERKTFEEDLPTVLSWLLSHEYVKADEEL